MAVYGNNYNYGDSPYYKDEEGPIVADNFYCDFDKIAVGAGSEIDPFNYEQFVNFFDPADGSPCYEIPSDGDVMNVKGIANLITRDSFIHMNQAVVGTVTVKPWDWAKNGIFLIESKDLFDSPVMLISNEGDFVIDHLVVEGFAILQNNTATHPFVRLYSAVNTTNPFFVELKNYQVVTRSGNIECVALDNVTAYSYGFTYSNYGLGTVYVGSAGVGAGSQVSMWDGVIHTDQINEAILHAPPLTEVFENIETNRPVSDIPNITPVNCTFESDAPALLPGPYYASEYNKSNFVYDDYGFVNTGKGEAYWLANGYTTGIGFAERYGIGAFYFYAVNVIRQSLSTEIRPVVLCEEPEVQSRVFWEHISTFWDFLTDPDRDMFETFWEAMNRAGNDMIKKAQRFFETTAPENARTCVLEDYYDIMIGPLHSRPIDLDPTEKAPNYTIRPLAARLIEPLYDDNHDPIYRDMIEITAADYYKIREIGLDEYVVTQVKKDGVNDKAFLIYNLLSSEEAQDRPAFAEVNETLHYDTGNNSTIGKIGLTADDYMEDVSEYNVLIYPNEFIPSAVVWSVDALVVSVRASDGLFIDDIANMINVSDPNKWATASNRSPKDKTGIPFMLTPPSDPLYLNYAVKFKLLPRYMFSEESGGRYHPPAGKKWEWFEDYSLAEDGPIGTVGEGEWVDSLSMFKYVIEIVGDLSFIGDESFTIYLTTGKVYDIANYVEQLPSLQNFIEPENGVPLYQDIDYRFYNNTVEFFDNLFEKNRAVPNETLYCPKASLIEHMLFEMYGTMVNVPRWDDYNYTNTSAKAAINTLMKSLQNTSNLADYERALNVYYGLPVSPQRSDVVGLYESYGYKVLSVSENNVTLELPDNQDLHPFVQDGCTFMIELKGELGVSAVVDRSTGVITLSDASDVEVDDLMYLRLNNRYAIKSFYAEDLSTETPGYIDLYIPEGSEGIQHVIDVLQTVSDNIQYPELLIYGTEGLEHNYNGIFHVTEAVQMGGVTRLTVYQKSDDDAQIYNDFVGLTTENISAGFAHFAWPTHKFLYLYLDTHKYFKAYIDSPLDTIYDIGDVLQKYDIITRNVSVLNNTTFPGWSQFDHFRRYNGLNLVSDILEVTNVIPGAKFGEYFPSACVKLV